MAPSSDIAFTAPSESVMNCEALVGLVEALGLKDVTLVGGSAGSRITLMAARVALRADYPHAERAGEARHPLADLAQADDAERLATHLGDGEDCPVALRLLAHRPR